MLLRHSIGDPNKEGMCPLTKCFSDFWTGSHGHWFDPKYGFIDSRSRFYELVVKHDWDSAGCSSFNLLQL